MDNLLETSLSLKVRPTMMSNPQDSEMQESPQLSETPLPHPLMQLSTMKQTLLEQMQIPLQLSTPLKESWMTSDIRNS